MFGRGKFQPGVLIIPNAGYEIDPDDVQALKDFRASIWYGTRLTWSLNLTSDSVLRDTVELANENAPQHSRIFKEVRICHQLLYLSC